MVYHKGQSIIMGRVVYHREWSITEDGLSSRAGWSISFYQGSVIRVVFHQGQFLLGLSFVRGSFIRVVFCQGQFLLGWSFVRVSFYQGGLLSGSVFIRVVFSQGQFLLVWSFLRGSFY